MKGVASLVLCMTLAGWSVCFFDRDRITNTRRRLQAAANPNNPVNNFVTMKVPMSIYELSSPVDYTSQGSPGNGTGAIGLIISPVSHDANYILIRQELKGYEDLYSSCINALSDNDFSDATVDNCVGINFNYVYDDCDYEKSKILARTDAALRDYMIQNCYTIAGVDLVLSNACDLIERDAVNLLWNELNFAALLDYHRNKYIFEYSYINETLFNDFIDNFTLIFNETNSLLNELYDHRQITVSHLEDLISLRTSNILQKYQDQGSLPPARQVISVVLQDDDWKKRLRSLQGHDHGFKAPASRFLELNTKNMRVRALRTAGSEAGKAPKVTAGKISVDGDKPAENGGV